MIVALLGASLPNSLFYFAASHVQAVVLSITVALIPIITYGIAMTFGFERLSALRIGGVAIGLLVLPESSLPSPAAIPWVLLACGSAVCYAAENVYLSRPALADIGPVSTATGMNIMASVIMLPLALAIDQMFLPAMPFSTLEWAIVALGVITAVAYTLFIMVINIAGPVFASQTGYLSSLAGGLGGGAVRRDAFTLGLGVGGDDDPGAGTGHAAQGHGSWRPGARHISRHPGRQVSRALAQREP